MSSARAPEPWPLLEFQGRWTNGEARLFMLWSTWRRHGVGFLVVLAFFASLIAVKTHSALAMGKLGLVVLLMSTLYTALVMATTRAQASDTKVSFFKTHVEAATSAGMKISVDYQGVALEQMPFGLLFWHQKRLLFALPKRVVSESQMSALKQLVPPKAAVAADVR